MDCDKERVTHWLNNQLPNAERVDFEQHLTECSHCQQQVKETREMLTLLNQIQIPEPSKNMTARFQGMLDAYQDSSRRSRSWATLFNPFRQVWAFHPGTQLAYSFILLIMGLFLGYLFFGIGRKENNKEEIAALSSKVEEMQQVVLMAMLENPSASDRMKAVSYTEEITHVNNEVIGALFMTLNEDPNVNVRLVTLEALGRYYDNPSVRQGLIQSISEQQSPLVLSALADLMTNMQEKNALESFRKLLTSDEVLDPVRKKIEQTIIKLSV